MAFGYLSVLLGFLCLHSRARLWICGRIEGATLKPLTDALDEFLQYYRKAGRSGTHSDIERCSGNGYVGRLEELVEQLKLEGTVADRTLKTNVE